MTDFPNEAVEIIAQCGLGEVALNGIAVRAADVRGNDNAYRFITNALAGMDKAYRHQGVRAAWCLMKAERRRRRTAA